MSPWPRRPNGGVFSVTVRAGMNEHLRALWQWRGTILTTAIVAAFVDAYFVASKTAKEIVLPLSMAALILYHLLVAG
jgi:hypothetical protein